MKCSQCNHCVCCCHMLDKPVKPDLKFDVGETWLSREGKKYIVLSTSKPGPRSLVVTDLEGTQLLSYPSTGRWANLASDHDLVALYTPPKTKDVWLVLTDKSVVKYDYEPDVKICKAHMPNATVLAIQKVTITEGEGI
jgi:hypothetical protein